LRSRLRLAVKRLFCNELRRVSQRKLALSS
jgi:hypothetical protein